MEKIVGVAQLYFMPHPLLEIVQRLMAHPVLLEDDMPPEKTYIEWPLIFLKMILNILNTILANFEYQFWRSSE